MRECQLRHLDARERPLARFAGELQLICGAVDHAEALPYVRQPDAARHRLVERVGEESHPVVFDLDHRAAVLAMAADGEDRKSTRLNSSHSQISYAVFCLK